MIAKTFLALSKTKDVDKITVKDLVEACHISRQTFYYHFQDILEVIEWSVQQIFQEILVHTTDMDAPEDTLRTFLESSSEVDALLKKLLHSQRREQIEGIFVDVVRSCLRDMLDRQEVKPDLSISDAKVALDFCTYGIVGLLLENCGKKSLDREKMKHQTRRKKVKKTDTLEKKKKIPCTLRPRRGGNIRGTGTPAIDRSPEV